MNVSQTRRKIPIHPDSGFLASSLHGLLRAPLSQNRSKISPKSVRFRLCDFSNASPQVTYNFNAVKWTDFLPVATEMTKRTDPLRSGRIRTILEFARHNALNYNSLRFQASGSSGLTPSTYTVQNRTKSNKIERNASGTMQNRSPSPSTLGSRRSTRASAPPRLSSKRDKMRHFSKPKNMTRCGRVTYDESPFALSHFPFSDERPRRASVAFEPLDARLSALDRLLGRLGFGVSQDDAF